jgi:hypothetical protein
MSSRRVHRSQSPRNKKFTSTSFEPVNRTTDHLISQRKLGHGGKRNKSGPCNMRQCAAPEFLRNI